MEFLTRERKGALLTITGGICWGLSGSMGQYLFSHEGMDSRWLVPVRLGLAGVILLLRCFLRYKNTVFLPFRTSEDRRDLLIYGIAGISMCQFFYFQTIQYSSAAIATILQDLSPVMILAAECRIHHRMPQPAELLSIALALLGVYLLSTHGNPGTLAIAPRALLSGILCAFCVMIYNVYPKRLLSRHPITVLQGWAFLLGSLFFCILFQPWNIPVTLTPAGIFGIAFVVLVGNTLAFPLYMSGLRLIGPQKSILYCFSEPLCAAVVSVLVFHQKFTPADFAGFLLIFLTLVLISLPKKSS